MKLIKAAMFVFGLILAGSDGPYMPWINGLGLLIFFGMLFVPIKKKENKHYA